VAGAAEDITLVAMVYSSLSQGAEDGVLDSWRRFQAMCCKGKGSYIMYERSTGPRAKEARQKQLNVATIYPPRLSTKLAARIGKRLWNVNSLFPRCFIREPGSKCNGWQAWMALWYRVYLNTAFSSHLSEDPVAGTIGKGEGRSRDFPFAVETPLPPMH
jgi:hypothetical protein